MDTGKWMRFLVIYYIFAYANHRNCWFSSKKFDIQCKMTCKSFFKNILKLIDICFGLFSHQIFLLKIYWFHEHERTRKQLHKYTQRHRQLNALISSIISSMLQNIVPKPIWQATCFLWVLSLVVLKMGKCSSYTIPEKYRRTSSKLVEIKR